MQYTHHRELIANLEAELQKLAMLDPLVTAKIDVSGAKAALAALVTELAFGPEPETRLCPYCGKRGMRTATICGYCWHKTPVVDINKLAPLR